MLFTKINDLDVCKLEGVKGLFYFKLENNPRIWLSKAAVPAKKLTALQTAAKTDLSRTTQLPCTLRNAMLSPDELLVHFKQVNGAELNEVYEREYARLKDAHLLGKRTRDFRATAFGFIEVTHGVDTDVVYYLSYRLTSGHSKAITAFKAKLKAIRVMSRVSKSDPLIQLVNGKSETYLKRFKFKVLDGLVSRGSEAAVSMMLALTDNANNNNKVVLNKLIK